MISAEPPSERALAPINDDRSHKQPTVKIATIYR